MNSKLLILSTLVLNVLSCAMDLPHSRLSRMHTFEHTTPQERAGFYSVIKFERKQQQNECELITSIENSEIQVSHFTSLIKLLHIYNVATRDNTTDSDSVYLKCIAPDKSKSYLKASYNSLREFISTHVELQDTIFIPATNENAFLINYQHVDYPIEVLHKITLSEEDIGELLPLLEGAKENNMACIWECNGRLHNIQHVMIDDRCHHLLSKLEADLQEQQLPIKHPSIATTTAPKPQNLQLLQTQEPQSLLSSIGTLLGRGLGYIAASEPTIHTLSAVGMTLIMVPLGINTLTKYKAIDMLASINPHLPTTIFYIGMGSAAIATAIHLLRAGKKLHTLAFQPQK